MLILGTTSTKPIIDTGSFACPHCESQQDYERRQIRQWFTVYFIPVIPLGTQGEYLRCKRCKGEFDVGVLTGSSPQLGPTSVDFVEALLVIVACDRGKPSTAMTRQLQQVLAELRDEPVSSETVAGLIAQGIQTRYSAGEFATQVGRGITAEDRIKAVVLLDELVRCPGDEHPGGLAILEQVAAGLGISAIELDAILSQLEEP